jgi:hypothetical protein
MWRKVLGVQTACDVREKVIEDQTASDMWKKALEDMKTSKVNEYSPTLLEGTRNAASILH